MWGSWQFYPQALGVMGLGVRKGRSLVSEPHVLVRSGRGVLGLLPVRAGGGVTSASLSESWRVIVGYRRDPVPGMAFGNPVRRGRCSIVSDDGGAGSYRMESHARWPHTPWVCSGFPIAATRDVMVKANKKGR